MASSEREVEHADKQNGELKEENVNLVATSETLMHRARTILNENRNLKASLASLKEKVQMGVNYASKMEKDVEDKGSSVLAVLEDGFDDGLKTMGASSGGDSSDSSLESGSESNPIEMVHTKQISTSLSGSDVIAAKKAASSSVSEASVAQQESSADNSVSQESSADNNKVENSVSEDSSDNSKAQVSEKEEGTEEGGAASSFLQMKKIGIKKSASATKRLTSTSLDGEKPEEIDSGSMLGVLNHELKQLKAEEGI